MQRRLTAGIAVVLALVVASAGPAMSATNKAPTKTPRRPTAPPNSPEVNSWALAPTGTTPSEPSSRVFLSYDVAPGSTVHDSVTLWNYSNVQLTFAIYATDAFNNANGAFDLLAGGKKPTDAGAWVRLPQANVTAAARSKIDIPFTVAVPPGARPGDHAGAILASNQAEGTGPDGKVVLLDRRTGSRMYVRVSGPAHPALTIDQVHTVYHASPNPFGGSLDVTYTIRNTGNVRLAAHQRVEASGPFGISSKGHVRPNVPELLPGNAITLHDHFNGVPALIRDGASIKLQPFSAATDVKPAGRVNRDARTWAIPWIIVVLALLAWLGRKAYVPFRQRRRVVTQPSQPPRERISSPS